MTQINVRLKRFGVFRIAALIGIFGILTAILMNQVQNTSWFSVDQLYGFTAIFLGIFIEAAPYLLLGTLASGLVEEFLDAASFMKIIPKRGLSGALAGGLLGLFFPVCECGVVPLTRRLVQKGLPLPVGIAFLLAAPVVNPIVIASTLSAFGFGPIFWGRIGITLGIAVVTGFLFSLQPDATQVLRPAPFTTNVLSETIKTSRDPRLSQRFQRVFLVAADEFIEMGKFLVAGALLAALLQTFVPQNALLALGSGPAISPLIMAALAAILSICSTVDAFIALAFTNTFSAGSILTFLVFGPMVDIKSVLMYLRVFRRRTVVYLVMIPLLLSILAGLMMNLIGGM